MFPASAVLPAFSGRLSGTLEIIAAGYLDRASRSLLKTASSFRSRICILGGAIRKCASFRFASLGETREIIKVAHPRRVSFDRSHFCKQVFLPPSLSSKIDSRFFHRRAWDRKSSMSRHVSRSDSKHADVAGRRTIRRAMDLLRTRSSRRTRGRVSLQLERSEREG